MGDSVECDNTNQAQHYTERRFHYGLPLYQITYLYLATTIVSNGRL